ncbi:MAG: magnesium transporter, partial [Bacillus sp. (in: Bacteria)]|nr:magnesium transporter [Bacillus sp. (in: firmicutes)]
MIKNMTQNELSLMIIKTLKESKQAEFEKILEELQPYDIAKIYKGLPEKHKGRFLLFLNFDGLVDLMEELDKEEQLGILDILGIEKSSKVLDLMDNDDLALLLNELSPEKRDSLLSGMKEEESNAVKGIMKYPPETAGRIMTNRFIRIQNNFTVREAVDKFKTFARFAESI